MCKKAESITPPWRHSITSMEPTTTTIPRTRTTRATNRLHKMAHKSLSQALETCKSTTTSEKMAHINKTTTKTTMARNTTRAAHRKINSTARRKCTRRWCLLAFYSALLAAHTALAASVGELRSQRLTATTTTTTTERTTTTAATTSTTNHYSQPLTAAANSFRPLIPVDLTPEDISRQVFTPKGQFRVFESAESDLRAASTVRRHDEHVDGASAEEREEREEGEEGTGASTAANEIPTSGDKELEALLSEYVQSFFEKGRIEPLPGLVFALQKNGTHMGIATPVAEAEDDEAEEATDLLVRHVRNAVTVGGDGGGGGGRSSSGSGSVVSINIPRAMQSGRFLFFTGLKKVLWPVYMGLQILKSLLFALLLPTLIGSVGKLLGKGIISGSAPLFIRPMDAPQEVDFKDNSLNFDDDNKFAMNDFEGTKDDGYAYNQPEASQTQNQYVYNAASINQQALSRYGNEQQKMQDSYLSALQSLSSASFKNSNSISGSSSAGGLGGGLGGGALAGLGGGGGAAMAAPTRSTKPSVAANVNTFQTFQKVPASSLLLSNYDPFYSPLLSRLDSVFAQLKLNSENEVCREKLICLMYANPAKYAPYSNLVSAQLSRELNELRKPTSDNPDILRFFKYMRAAKDGQDGVDCEKTFASCDEFQDFENPAMVSTYNDINKLVQARKLTT